jgi:tRNA(Ile)-lysidine synthase
MALLALLSGLRQKWKLALAVLYCHHGLRAEADEEESFVREWSERFSCPFVSRRLPVREYHKKTGKSIQEAARELRYRIFEEERSQRDFDFVALAHTANDQAEEVLIGLIRGSGLGGLAGMPIQRGPFIRPLLRTFRAEILKYLAQKNIPYKEDASNYDRRYLRTRVRHELLEELKGYSPNIIAQLNQMAGLLQKDEEYLQGEVTRVIRGIVSYSGQAIYLNRSKLGALPQALGARVIQRVLLERMGQLSHIRSVHILSILKATKGSPRSGWLPLPNDWSANWDRETVTILQTPIGPKLVGPFLYPIERPGKYSISETGDFIFLRKVRDRSGPISPADDKNRARVDFDSLTWPLVLRNHKPGDRFEPLGLRGSKKVSRFFIDRRVPGESRSRIPLICSGEKIVWIAGMEIGHLFRLTPQTTKILEMVYGKGEDR